MNSVVLEWGRFGPFSFSAPFAGAHFAQRYTDSTREAHSSGRSRHSLELNQSADVVTEVHHPDLEPRPHDADGAHDLAAHRVLLVAEDMLDTGAHLRARRVRRLLAL